MILRTVSRPVQGAGPIGLRVDLTRQDESLGVAAEVAGHAGAGSTRRLNDVAAFAGQGNQTVFGRLQINRRRLEFAALLLRRAKVEQFKQGLWVVAAPASQHPPVDVAL